MKILPPVLNLEYLFSTHLGLIYQPTRRIIFWSIFAESLISWYFYSRAKRTQQGLNRKISNILAKYFGLLALTQALLVFFREQTAFFLSAPIVWLIIGLAYIYYAFRAYKSIERIKQRALELDQEKEKEKYINP